MFSILLLLPSSLEEQFATLEGRRSRRERNELLKGGGGRETVSLRRGGEAEITSQANGSSNESVPVLEGSFERW